MKMTLTLSLLLAVVIGMFAAGCQKQVFNNGVANTNANTGHDMANMNHGMSSMPGHDMANMNSDLGATEQPYDLQYLDSMIHHHNGAIMMAKMILDKTEKPELKAFAQNIIDDQKIEIDYMQQLRERWYMGKPSAVNMEMPGMIGGMKMMNGDHMKEMDEMEPAHLNGHFLKMMIAHHEGAVTMSKDTNRKAEHSEIVQLAEKIIKTQQPEIEQMKKWQTAWNK